LRRCNAEQTVTNLASENAKLVSMHSVRKKGCTIKVSIIILTLPILEEAWPMVEHGRGQFDSKRPRFKTVIDHVVGEIHASYSMDGIDVFKVFMSGD
jgi:hypothetical protein